MLIKKIHEIEPEDILFGCIECFWKRYFDSYVLQIESKRHMTEDKISINYQEALNIKTNRTKKLFPNVIFSPPYNKHSFNVYLNYNGKNLVIVVGEAGS